MFFNKNKSRYRAIEQGFDACRQLAVDEKVRRSLGSRASRFSEVAENFFVPNLQNGLVTIPNEYKESDSIPVLPTSPGEVFTLSLDFAQFSPLQRLSADRILDSYFASDARPSIDEVESVLSKRNPGIDVALSTSANASVTAMSRRLTIPNKSADPLVFRTLSRPLVLLDTKMQRTPSIVGHELTHVVQYAEEPLEPLPEQDTTHRERREVEAYVVGAAIEQVEGLNHDNQQNFVAAGKRLAKLDGEIQVTDLLRDHLKNNGYEAWNE